MLGWWIVISKGQADGTMPEKENILTNWKTGTGGLRWLDDMATQGKAKQLLNECYPNRYETSVADVLAIAESLTAPVPALAPLLDGFSPSQTLTIDAWDES